MIEYQMRTFVCPHCQKMFMKRIADIVRVEKEEERLNLITRIRNANNYINECPYCNHVFDVNIPLMYVDNVNKLSIIYIPSVAYLDEFLKIIKDHKEYTNRLVIGDTNEYSEKYDIMYSGISDKLLEIYRFELKSCLKSNYAVFNLVGDKLLVSVKIDDEVITKPLYKGLIDDIYIECKDEEYFKRDNDYIVNDLYIHSIFHTKEKLPVHEMIKKEHKTVALVRIDDLDINLYYKTDNNVTDIDVFVRVKSEIKKGHIIDVKSLTEEELGFPFSKLRRISKYNVSAEKYQKILISIMNDIKNNFVVSYKDALITRDIYDNYILNETLIQKDNILSFIDETKCESNCRYIIVSPNNNIRISSKRMIRVMNNNYNYYKVIGKEEIDGNYFIILLALDNNDAIFINNNITMPYEDNKEIYDKTWKYIKAATNSTYLLDLKDINDYNQLIGYHLGEKRIARDILIVEEETNNRTENIV